MSNDIPACEGITVSEKTSAEFRIPRSGGSCGRKTDPMLKGDDDKWRCLHCNKIYVELLYLDMERMRVQRKKEIARGQQG